MINIERLITYLTDYKKDFIENHWEDEKYKWIAVKHFQEHWDINAENFLEMFQTATEKTENLLASQNRFPRRMIMDFAKADPEATRALFINLFDERIDLIERIEHFSQKSEQLRIKYQPASQWTNHFQDANSISTYLWLRFPDKYYIYKYGEYKAVAAALESDYRIIRGIPTVTIGFQMYNEIHQHIIQDLELIEMFKSVLTSDCYEDPQFRSLTFDIGFYISRNQSDDGEDDAWFPTDYSPNISTEQWMELLKNGNVFDENSLRIMRRFQHIGGIATCKQLSLKYGETNNFYNSGSSALAKRVAEFTNCPIMTSETENSKWWPILYLGKRTDSREEGVYTWKLRDELKAALDKTNLSSVQLYTKRNPLVWKISHGIEFFSSQELSDLVSRNLITVHRDTKSKGVSKISQGMSFIHSMREGDYFYLCNGNQIKLLGKITENDAIPNDRKEEGWFQRNYVLVNESIKSESYNGVSKWWTPNNNSTCIQVPETDYKLFEELILQPYFDLTVNALLGKTVEEQGYWWSNANPKIWSFSNIAIGEKQKYTLYNDNGNKRRIFQNFLDVKPGDCLIGYESNPVKQIVALGKITQGSDGESIHFEKTEDLVVPVDYSTLKGFPELENMEYFASPQGSLFKLTKSEYEFILDLIREANPIPQSGSVAEYSKKLFLETVYMSEERLNTLENLLKTKKNLIIQGAPGVGKTFVAKRLAYALMECKDDSRIEFIQFHQNYSYEDFVMGYKPDENGFRLKPGIFHDFCKKASNQPDKDFYFIIDEINRGNLSKILGELLMLIENYYRGTKATLAYTGLPFTVPENLYIIGLMNTADRSLAMIDYALRRRFSFFEMEPGFNSQGFRDYQAGFKNETFNKLIDRVKELNNDITIDQSLGKGFCIGHSYFCNRKVCTDQWMMNVVNYEILPMLSEYWFDEPVKLRKWENILLGVFND
jgi:hypothetical protein